jgi:hypothetical protein
MINDDERISSSSPTEIAVAFDVSVSTVYGWIRRGRLNITREDGRIAVLFDEHYSILVRDWINKKYSKTPEPFFPNELTDYGDWHQTIDYISWLFKVCYSDRSEVKKKQFNIRRIFENYLTTHKISLKSVRNNFHSGNLALVAITDDLKRGWYNELAFSYPQKVATLGISFREIHANLAISNNRFLFPSWKITEAYYSAYFYFRSIALYKNPNFRLEEHKATLNSFKSSALKNFQKSLWKFPLDIEYRPGKRFYAAKTLVGTIDHLKYGYCKHPRAPYLSPLDIVKKVQDHYRRRAKRFKKSAHYTIFDFLLEFRIWANYLDIDNLLSFYGGGYKAFLDQNLSLLLFFFGGLCELPFIANFGEEKYLYELQNLYTLFSKNNDEGKHNFVYTPIYQRMRIYRLIGFVESEINVEIPPDENLII